jgi:hypothetical protein
MSLSLDRVGIASPCDVSWDAMEGEGAVRFCGQCQLNVYNLSEMPRDEAEAFINAPGDGERRCIRLYRRKDGTVLTQNCPVGFARLRRRFTLLRAGVAAGLSMVLGGFMTGCEPSQAKTRGRPLPSAQPDPTPATDPAASSAKPVSPLPASPAQTPDPMPGPDIELLMGEMEACPTQEEPVEATPTLEEASAQDTNLHVEMGRMIHREPQVDPLAAEDE